MERRFKAYVYEEGEPPILHEGPCKNIYTIEGRFIEQLELMSPPDAGSGVRTWDPSRAHAFFLPFSVSHRRRLRPRRRRSPPLLEPLRRRRPLHALLPGAPGAGAGAGVPPAPRLLRRRPARSRPRPPAPPLEGPLPVYEYDLPGASGAGNNGRRGDYYSFMRRARFCLCPSGHEVASPRVVEAIQSECVPVVIADGYVLPFADVLRWEAFSVAVAVGDIPRVRETLERIPAAEVERLRRGVRLVKRHLMLQQPPRRLDMFNMILHSVWLRRLDLRLHS
uniref:Exostosin GT47 domain-containing protein n=1 Tax=Oryza punctata TaxID=4537 RepID=A0A0E0KM45_ORYPU